jgi:hypothetical protein
VTTHGSETILAAGRMMAGMPRRTPEPALASPTIRAVRAGDEITVEVLGGFVRRHAPSDGVVVQMDDRDVFVDADLLVEALRTLGRIPTTR